MQNPKKSIALFAYFISGSLWKPDMTQAMILDKEKKKLFVIVGFEAAEYSERYQVSIQSQTFHYSHNVSKVKTPNVSHFTSDNQNSCVRPGLYDHHVHAAE